MSNTITANETQNTVSVNETTNTVTVTESVATTVRVATEGPQGPSFALSTKTMIDTNRVDKSIIYYDSASGSYKADSTWTASTLTDGGNF